MNQDNRISPLEREMRASIRERALTFKEYMALALYHPQYGYYTSQDAPGRDADFFTSVSVGSCFGELLAEWIHGVWERSDSPADFTVLEQGGHVGALAADVITAINANFPALYKSFRFLALERSSRAMSDPRLAEHDCWSRLPDVDAVPPGSVDLYFANELIDAFPVHRLIWRGPELGWAEQHVTEIDDSLGYTDGPLSTPDLAERVASIDVSDFDSGYVTEMNLEIAPWLSALTPALKPTSTMLVIDYGMPASTYYLPSRREGTLQAYQNHQHVSNLLAAPGEQDLTAHVDFTYLETVAKAHGLSVARLEEQSRFLTRIAREPLMAMEARLQGASPDNTTQAWIRQFQQLTTMGPNFKVMELTRGDLSA